MDKVMVDINEKPPSSMDTTDIMGIGSAGIPVDDIKGKRGVGFWRRFTQPIFYPAGGALLTRCGSIYLSIRE